MSHPTYVGFLVSRMECVIEPKEEPADNIDLSEVTIKEEILQNDYDIQHFENVTYSSELLVTANQKLKEVSSDTRDSAQTLPTFLNYIENALESSSIEDSALQDDNLLTKKVLKKRVYKNVQCTICKKEYSAKYIKLHILTHSENDKPKTKRVQCEVCNVSICDKALPGHLLIHTGERPFVCTTCGKQFRKADTLKAHEVSHATERPFKCSFCYKTFKRKRYLNLHHRIHNDDKRYTCEQCGKKFTFKSTHDLHVRIHNNDKHICTFCGKPCISKSQLNSHLVKHTKERKYECAACGYKFGLPTHLKTHVTMYCKGAPKTDTKQSSELKG